MCRGAEAREAAGHDATSEALVTCSFGVLAQLGERGLCKPEVRGSTPLCSTMKDQLTPLNGVSFLFRLADFAGKVTKK